jgi:hypothetical protein
MEQTRPSWTANALNAGVAAGVVCAPFFLVFLVDLSTALTVTPDASVVLIVLPISRATLPITKAQAADNFMLMDDE